MLRRLELRTPSLAQTVGNLSGGNQQKISVAKWLAAGVRILIVDEPTVGIDIKTKVYLHELLRALADQGTTILLITSDMPEMITLADRIVVMDGYRLTGTLVSNRNVTAQWLRVSMRLIHGDEKQGRGLMRRVFCCSAVEPIPLRETFFHQLRQGEAWQGLCPGPDYKS